MNEIRGCEIVKKYGDVVALNRVNIEIKEGEIVVILGPSGSGKTTLLNILGLLDKPTEGRVFLNGKDITDVSEEKGAILRNRNFGFIFQFFYLIPELTVIENVMLPLWIKEKSPLKLKRYYREAEELLAEFGMEKRKDFYPSQLSGGELQRVAICRSLICSPSIIFADEPTGSIDKNSAKVFYEIMERLNKEKKVSFVIATHNEKFLQFASKVVYLKEGEVEKVENLKKR